MRASIYKLNPANGYAAADPDANGQYFSIIDLQAGSAALGDEVSWEGEYPLGPAKLTNHRTNETFDVIFENHDVSKEHLLLQLRIEE